MIDGRMGRSDGWRRAAPIIDAYLKANAWDVDGGLDGHTVQRSLDFFMETGSLPPGLTSAQVADLSHLNASWT